MSSHARTVAGLKLLPAGISAILVATPFLLWGVFYAPAHLIEYIGPIPIVSPETSVEWIPELDREFDPMTWLISVLAGIGRFVFAAIYLSALTVGIGGIIASISGTVLLGNPDLVTEAIKRWTDHWVVRFVLGVYVLMAAAIFVPGLLIVLIELSVAFFIGGSLFGILGLGWLRFRSKASLTIRIVFAYPLGIGTIILPLIVTALVSPTFAETAQFASEQFAIVILDTIFAIGDVNQWIRDTFDLDGSGYFVMWGGIALVSGWILGIGTEFVSRSWHHTATKKQSP